MGDKSPKNNTKAKKQKADKKASSATHAAPVSVVVPKTSGKPAK
jgi:hypothetical protein